MIELTPDLILKAYACGVFPMAERHDASEVYWIDPDFRGILPLDRFHVPRRLSRTIRSGLFEIRVDHDFLGTVRGCARRTGKRRETWINTQIVEVFAELHERGYAHSVEAWRDDQLVGGLYGVALGGAFFGESMFSLIRDASKVALVALVERLRRGGYSLLDTQFVTAHLRTFGATEIPRSQYLARLADALSRPASFYSVDEPAALSAASSALAGRQSTTQTS